MTVWVVLAALAAVTAGCASSGRAVPRPFPTPGARTVPPEPPASTATPLVGAGTVADTALSFRGSPYRLGGSDPSGFDCSGLVQYVLAQHGLSIPRVVRHQFRLGRSVSAREIQPGDLLFFAVGSRHVTHVGIAIGPEQFVHAPNTGQFVRVDALSSPYWWERYAGARRLQ
jgi:cell wall-associated NlpC family hydrolase